MYATPKLCHRAACRILIWSVTITVTGAVAWVAPTVTFTCSVYVLGLVIGGLDEGTPQAAMIISISSILAVAGIRCERFLF